VFEAFTEVRHLSQWLGPEGFTTTTRAFEFRVGGEWVFVMHGPDGTDYQEWISWTEIVPLERIEMLNGEPFDALSIRRASGHPPFSNLQRLLHHCVQ
jgi:uncharacterized protein YndB with AHSA1/START domain